jgi:hypothetical protein
MRVLGINAIFHDPAAAQGAAAQVEAAGAATSRTRDAVAA